MDLVKNLFRDRLSGKQVCLGTLFATKATKSDTFNTALKFYLTQFEIDFGQ